MMTTYEQNDIERETSFNWVKDTSGEVSNTERHTQNRYEPIFFFFFYQIDDMPDDFSFVTNGTKTERIRNLKPQDAQILIDLYF